MSDFGKLYVVGTPIGNLSDFSPRGIQTLQSVGYIAAEDTRVTLRLLSHFGIKKPLLSYYKPHEEEKSAKILELLYSGESIALVSDAGMPCISDPGYYLVKRCHETGVSVESVPCCNAAITAVAVSGIDTSRFTFEGFLPTARRERIERLEQVKALPHTLVFYEAPHKLRHTLADLREHFGGERFCALCRELTKIHEEIGRGTLEELCKEYETREPRGEYVIVVEGAHPETAGALTPEEAAEIAMRLVEGGMKLSGACREAARQSGVSRQEIYRLLHADEDPYMKGR